MDPSGSDQESSLLQPDNPCLIVEDSQPDSAALEDDPDSSYRALLARRLSSLQPTSHSPVLELISSPAGSRSSQIDSQSEKALSNQQSDPDVLKNSETGSAPQEQRQVLEGCPLPVRSRCAEGDLDMESGADSTTHCARSEGETSQFGFMELSESQDQGHEVENRDQEEDEAAAARTHGKSKRSEVSSSSSSEPPGRAGRGLSVQALLHSQGLQASADQDQKDSELLSSQEDLFDCEKTGTGVDSTVSELQNQVTLTPAHTLRLLHLSGQGTLVQESLSQNSVDFVAPTQDNVNQHLLIVPNSPTGQENEHGTGEPMDTSSAPEDQLVRKEGEPSETDSNTKICPSASTPGFALDRTLSLPSQPEFSHDVFVPTQSQEAGPHETHKKKVTTSSSSSLHNERQRTAPGLGSSNMVSTTVQFKKPTPGHEYSVNESFQLELSVNTESCSPAQQSAGPAGEQDPEEDSQATQIEGSDGPPGTDTGDSVTPRHGQRTGNNGISSELETAAKHPPAPDSPRTGGERARNQECTASQKSTHKSVNSQSLPEASSGRVSDTVDLTSDGCVQETPSSSNSAPCSWSSQSQSVFSQASRGSAPKDPPSSVNPRGGLSSRTSSHRLKDPATSSEPLSQKPATGGAAHSQVEEPLAAGGEEGDVMEEEGEKRESTVEPERSVLYLALSQSQVLSPEAMDEGADEGAEGGEEGCGVLIPDERERSSQLLEKEGGARRSASQPLGSRGRGPVSTNGSGSQPHLKDTRTVPDRLSQTGGGGPREPDGLRDKSLSDSSGDIPFHFTLPKEGELIGPAVSATPPLIHQLKQTPRHSTPIEMTSFSEKSASAAIGDVSTETAMVASDITVGESGEDTAEGGDGKLSLRMKLVTPVEEGSSGSERFSLQKPPLSDEEGSVSKVTTVAKALNSSSVFSRVKEAHRQVEAEDESLPSVPATPVRVQLFGSSRQERNPQRTPVAQGRGAPASSQPEPSSSPMTPPSEPSTPGRATQRGPQTGTAACERSPSGAPEPSTPTRAAGRPRAASQQTIAPSPPSKLLQRAASQQTSVEGPGPRSPTGRVEPETPPLRGTAGPTHCRHVRTIQEVRTTVTRVITDVYYEDGREVDRKVMEESEEPVVESRVLDSDISPCRTVSSLTSGDLADISSGGTSSGTVPSFLRRPDFIMPPSRGAKSASPRRGSGLHQRGHRGQMARPEVKDRDNGAVGSQAPLTPRGRARRGRPPSRSPQPRGGGSAGPRVAPRGQPMSSSEDEPHARLCSPVHPDLPSRSASVSSSPGEASQAGSSFVGLRVVAKWSSNGYFYSGCITKDLGEGRFSLLFDDSYECEVSGKDILLCDPIPMETEVTALLENEYFSIGVVKGHKTEGKELFYGVEQEGQRQWYSRSAVILSLEQGNRLREQYGLGPYEPATPLTKASDISLDNLVEGKRRRRGGTAGQGTPNRSSSNSPRTPGPSGKRKLVGSEDERSPAKRGRRGGGARGGGARGGGARGGQRAGVCNTSGSGTDLPREPADLAESHGPLPQSASLFMGFAFMLTASSESDRQTNLPVSDGEEEYVQTAPYNKGYTETQLQAGGGFVLLEFNEEQCKAAYQSLLIADQHCRTRKYLLCVASGVPCVSHIWVRDCCKDNKLLNYRNYLLPAGMGPDERVVEWHPRSCPFKALRVLLVFEEPVELWSQLLTLSGAASVRHFQADKDCSDIPEGKFDVVVTDRTCPPLVLKSVTSQSLALVSPEWLIQSMICGERLGYHSNPQYRHDYTSS